LLVLADGVLDLLELRVGDRASAPGAALDAFAVTNPHLSTPCSSFFVLLQPCADACQEGTAVADSYRSCDRSSFQPLRSRSWPRPPARSGRRRRRSPTRAAPISRRRPRSARPCRPSTRRQPPRRSATCR